MAPTKEVKYAEVLRKTGVLLTQHPCNIALIAQSTYRMGGKFRAIQDFALFRKFRGY